MSLFKTIIKPHLYNSHKKALSILHRTFTSSSAQLQPDQTHQTPLSTLFQEAVGLSCERAQETHFENNELKTKLLALEREVRDLKALASAEEEPKNEKEKKEIVEEKKPERRSLYAAFTRKSAQETHFESNELKTKIVQEKKPDQRRSLFSAFTGKGGVDVGIKRREQEKEARVLKELSPDMEVFVKLLYEEGYFKTANFLRGGKLDFNAFDDGYSRDFIKYAAEKYGKDHQEIAKWLSGSDLKKVALFGCPSVAKKNVFSAKRLRNYFRIQEDTVCSKCVLKHSCKFVNQSVWKGAMNDVDLAVVMRVITLYALEAVHPDLSVPDEIKASVSQLLKEVMKLSKTVS